MSLMSKEMQEKRCICPTCLLYLFSLGPLLIDHAHPHLRTNLPQPCKVIYENFPIGHTQNILSGQQVKLTPRLIITSGFFRIFRYGGFLQAGAYEPWQQTRIIWWWFLFANFQFLLEHVSPERERERGGGMRSHPLWGMYTLQSLFHSLKDLGHTCTRDFQAAGSGI